MSARFRYRAEGAEARAWRLIATNVERHHGQFVTGRGKFIDGLCNGVETHMERLPWEARSRAYARIKLFKGFDAYIWPLWEHEDERGPRTDRITAAWLCYWMAREEGV